MVHDAFSERQQQQGGDERHWIPLAKMMGGCIPIPPAVDAPADPQKIGVDLKNLVLFTSLFDSHSTAIRPHCDHSMIYVTIVFVSLAAGACCCTAV